MRSCRVRPRRAPLVLVLVAAGLAGCGQQSSSDSPFRTPSKDSDGDKVAQLGFPIVATSNTTRTATSDPVAAAAGTAEAVFSGGTAENKARAVALVDRSDWRTALAASALAAPPIGAPTLYTDGQDVPDETTGALKALAPTGSEAAGGAQVIRVGAVGRPGGFRTTDLNGKGASALALAIDRFTAAARRNTSDRVLVVSADRPDFAVPAAAWAAKTGDPIAFVHQDTVPPNTLRQLRDHQRPTLYVLGPSRVISPKVTRVLRTMGTVKRLGGADPVSNAVEFARYGDGSFGWNINEPGHGFQFARAGAPATAVTSATLGAHGLHGPLLLLDSADRLPAAVRDYLLDVQPGYTTDPVRGVYNRGWITGDVKAISARLQSQLDALLEIVPVNTATDEKAKAGKAAKPAPAPTTTTTASTPTPPAKP